MDGTTTRWSTGAGRPVPTGPPLVAPGSAWPAADPALVRGAVEHALARTRAALRRHDIAAALLADPANVRYASGTSIMPVWTFHSADRYLLVPAEGEPVLWEYAAAPPELVSPYPGLETRTATSWSVFGSGDAGRGAGRVCSPPTSPRSSVTAGSWASASASTGSTPTGSSPCRRRACTSCRRSSPWSRRAPSRGRRRSS